MVIKDDKKLIDIQKEFHETFPFLKLEFYRAHHEKGEGSPKKELLDPYISIGEIRKKKTEGEIKIHEDMRVADLEKIFYEKYGLNAQVFRRSRNLWLQTITTDSWTLAQQNQKARDIAKMHIKRTEIDLD